MAGGHEKGKRLVAAPVSAERYHVQPEVFHLIPYIIEESQTFVSKVLLPSCLPVSPLNEQSRIKSALNRHNHADSFA
jgi:hypothetical protein